MDYSPLGEAYDVLWMSRRVTGPNPVPDMLVITEEVIQGVLTDQRAVVTAQVQAIAARRRNMSLGVKV